MELQYHETRSKRKNRQDMRSECAVVDISEHSQVPSFPEPVASFGHALAPTPLFAYSSNDNATPRVKGTGGAGGYCLIWVS